MEVKLISEINPEYNLACGGQGGTAVRTPEWRANLSKSLKGRKSPKAWLGKHHSQETKDKIRTIKKLAAVSFRGIDLTQDRLRQLFSYDPENGQFERLVSNNQHASGRIARKLERGYLRIKVDGHQYMVHRLAWLYVYGEWPPHDLYHQNGDRADNRLVNLCLVKEVVNARERMLVELHSDGVRAV